MKTVLTIATLFVASVSSAMGFDAATQAVIDGQKIGKLVPISAVATLMGSSARWCYDEQDGTCGWSDVYLAVDPSGAEYEVSNAWDASVDIAFVDHGDFVDGRYICETAQDWLTSVRAVRRDDGSVVGGRALRDLKAEIAAIVGAPGNDCFDYVYGGADAGAQTLTLRQRQSHDGVHDPEQDVAVTLYFDPEAAAQLSTRW